MKLVDSLLEITSVLIKSFICNDTLRFVLSSEFIEEIKRGQFLIILSTLIVSYSCSSIRDSVLIRFYLALSRVIAEHIRKRAYKCTYNKFIFAKKKNEIGT